MNPGDNLGIWLAILACSTAFATWNIVRLRTVRPRLDRLVAMLGAVAILAVVIGVSLVVTEVTECTFAASSLACSSSEIMLVALTDLAVGAALVSLWLRSDVCHAPRAFPRTQRQRAA